MRWGTQVLHVARKDVRVLGLLWIAYVLVVGLVTAGATGMHGAAAGWIGPFGVVGVMVLGMVLLGIVVQADSPARSDAFWVTLPLRPLAVVSAKLLVALFFLLGPALLGQLAGISAHAVAAERVPGLLGESALQYGIWLSGAAVLASLTRDLRSFVLALVLASLGGVFGRLAVGSLLNPSGFPQEPAPRVASLLLLAAMALLLAHQYRMRHVRWGIVLALLIGAGWLLLPFARPRREDVLPAPGEIPARLLPTQLRVVKVEPTLVRGRAELTLQADGLSPLHSYVLVSPVVEMQMPDGSSHDLSVDGLFPIRLNPTVPHVEGYRWVEPPKPVERHLTEIPFALTSDQRQALAGGGVRLTVRGHLEVREQRVKLELPLLPGHSAAAQGQRVEVVRLDLEGTEPLIELRESLVGDSRSAADRRDAYPGWSRMAATFVLVNPGRREAVELRGGSGSANDFGLVLPGPRARTALTTFHPGSFPSFLDRMPEEWLEGARLQLLDWERMGSRPVVVGERGWRLERGSRR